jgi:hypothetical protein
VVGAWSDVTARKQLAVGSATLLSLIRAKSLPGSAPHVGSSGSNDFASGSKQDTGGLLELHHC